MTPRMQGGLLVRALSPPAALLLAARESYMTPSLPKYTRGSSYFYIEKLPVKTFFIKKTFNKI
jgi:hypothetical protein